MSSAGLFRRDPLGLDSGRPCLETAYGRKRISPWILLYPPAPAKGTWELIYLLYGGDDFSLQETLSSLKEAVEPAELRDVNIAALDGTRVTVEELVAASSTVPFLAEKRMVIVDGLLSLFEVRAPSRSASSRATSTRGAALGQWEPLAQRLSGIPETTDLVFVDGLLSESNPLLSRMRPLAKTLRFPLPSGRELPEWVRLRAAKLDAEIEPRAVAALAENVGRNLRMLDQELQKLSVYRGGERIRLQDVQDLVAHVKEANIFAAVDAVLEGRSRLAIRTIRQLVDAGRAPTNIITMIGRQVRLLLLAKDLKAQGVLPAEMGRRLSLSGYPLRKTLEQGERLTTQRLVEMHHRLLEADLGIKTGETDGQLALDLLIAELAAGRAGQFRA